MRELLFFEPTIKNYIWGNEYWTVSAHPHGDNPVKKGSFQGITLSRLWEKHRELFGNMEGDRFPLLVKEIDSRDDLSIQVHPDDAYAREHENGSFGKTECWYVIDCKPGGTIIIGHKAKTRDELKQMIREGRWQELLNEFPVKKGDFFQIEPGTVHAIKHDTVIMEIQQNSDITYRLYDYDRVKDGRPRPLHIEKSIDVITVPHRQAEGCQGDDPHRLVDCPFYTVDKYEIDGSRCFLQKRAFEIVSVIGGKGEIDGQPIAKGDSVLIPYAYGEYEVTGQIGILITGV